MSLISPYPHMEVEVEDRSAVVPVTEERRPLSRPIYFLAAQKGPVGIPVWRDTVNEFEKTFGKATLVNGSKYFTPTSYFIKTALKNSGAYFVRVAGIDADVPQNGAMEARMVAELAVATGQVPQWKTDSTTGALILDVNNNKIAINSAGQDIPPLQEIYDAETAAGTTEEDRTVTASQLVQKTVSGHILKWFFSPAPKGIETDWSQLAKTVISNADSVASVTLTSVNVETYLGREFVYQNEGTETTVVITDTNKASLVGKSGSIKATTVTYYPMFTFVASSVGEYGNSLGFKFWYGSADNTEDTIPRTGACIYRMAPVQIPYGESVYTSIRNKYSNTEITFAVKPNCEDPTTGAKLSIDKVLKASYSDDYGLDCKIQIFPEYFNEVGNLILANDPSIAEDLAIDYNGDGVNDWENSELGYMVNLFSGIDKNKNPYSKVQIVSSSSEQYLGNMNSSSVHYMMNGSDGDISESKTEEYIRLLFNDAENNEYLADRPRFPFNRIYDTGFSVATKKAMISLMGVFKDVKVYCGTVIAFKDATGKVPAINSKYADESLAQSLRDLALLQRESVIKGTGACRCTIFASGGKRQDYDRYLPGTLWIADKNATYLNKGYIDEIPVRLPNADVSIWNDGVIWTATTEDMKKRLWNYGVNYMQYYNKSSIHYAAVRTVHNYDTSVLVSDSYTDAVVFMKQLLAERWAYFASAEDPFAVLQEQISKDLLERGTYILHRKYGLTITVYETDEDKELGYSLHVDMELTSGGGKRVWVGNIICKRDGLTQEEGEE